MFSHIPPKLCALGPTVLSPALPCPVPAVEARFGMGWPYLLPRLQSWAGARPGDEWTARVSQGPEEEKGLLDRRLCWRDIDSTHLASFFLPLGSRPGDGREVKMPCILGVNPCSVPEELPVVPKVPLTYLQMPVERVIPSAGQHMYLSPAPPAQKCLSGPPGDLAEMTVLARILPPWPCFS